MEITCMGRRGVGSGLLALLALDQELQLRILIPAEFDVLSRKPCRLRLLRPRSSCPRGVIQTA